MSKTYRIFSTEFWDDDFVVNLNPVEKLFFIYLFTNEKTNVAGTYQISIRRMAFDTGVEENAIKNLIKRLEESGKVKYVDGWMLIRNYDRHQRLRGEKVEVLRNRIIDELPDRVSIAYRKGTDRLSDSDSVISDKEVSPSVKDVSEHYSKTIKEARLTSSARSKIKSRLQSFRESDLKKAIENFSQDNWQMKHNAHRGMAWFFHTDDRVEQYINLKPRKGIVEV